MLVEMGDLVDTFLLAFVCMSIHSCVCKDGIYVFVCIGLCVLMCVGMLVRVSFLICMGSNG